MKIETGKEIVANFTSEYPFYDLKKQKICCNVNLVAPKLDEEKEKRPPIDVICVVDKSGSMSGSKMKLTKETLEFMIEELQEDDNFGVVCYGSQVDTLIPLTKMTKKAKEACTQRVRAIKTTGCTNLSGGLKTGLDMMKNRIEPNEISSVFLMTDGLANEGITDTFGIVNMMRGRKVISGKNVSKSEKKVVQDEKEMLQSTIKFNYEKKEETKEETKEEKKEENQEEKGIGSFLQNLNPFSSNKKSKRMMNRRRVQQPRYQQQQLFQPNFGRSRRKRQVELPTEKVSFDYIKEGKTTVNCFGFGKDVDSDFLNIIAQRGNGIYYYIENNDDVGESFVNCLAGLVSTIGKDLKLTIKGGKHAKILKVFTKFKKTEIKDNALTIDVPDLQAEEARDFFVVAEIDEGSNDVNSEVLDIKLNYKNAIDLKNVESKIVGVVGRKEKTDGSAINIALDKVRNRLFCTCILQLANIHASEDNFGAAREICLEGIQIFKSSPSKDDEFTKALITDLEDTHNGLKDRTQFYKGTQQKMLNKWAGHQYQRAANLKESSQMAYSNANRSRMVKKMKSKKAYAKPQFLSKKKSKY